MTLASILVPIHDKPTTLPMTVDSVLRQSVQDLEVILIGDGVTEPVRRVVAELVAQDPRVRFLDFAKGPHHGERYRHDAIKSATSDAILYLCDDDLLLPDHVADLLSLLADHDLVQCLNGYVRADGQVRLFASDLADPNCVALHLADDLQYNSVSITGTAHTRAAYLRVSRWDTTPAGQWPDHWQFRKLMALPGFRGATSQRMTALQFPTSTDGRDGWDPDARAAEIVPWHRLVTGPGGQDEIDRRVAAGMRAQLVEERGRLATLSRDLAWLREQGASREEWAARTERDLRDEVAALRVEIEGLVQHSERLAELRADREHKIEVLRGRVERKNATIEKLRERLRTGPGAEGR